MYPHCAPHAPITLRDSLTNVHMRRLTSSKRSAAMGSSDMAQLAMLLDVYAACVRLHAVCAAMHPGVAPLPGAEEQLGSLQGGDEGGGADGHGREARSWGYFQLVFSAAGRRRICSLLQWCGALKGMLAATGVGRACAKESLRKRVRRCWVGCLDGAPCRQARAFWDLKPSHGSAASKEGKSLIDGYMQVGTA